VIDDITRLTGMAIGRVDVVVMDLEDEAEAFEEDEEDAVNAANLPPMPLN
jgi:hypothetical protein